MKDICDIETEAESTIPSEICNSDTENRVVVTYAEGFYYEPLDESIKQRINGKSYKENSIIDYSDLRYVTVQYYNFNGEVKQGELIVNVQVADDVVGIFKELFDNQYQIEKIKLVDEYDADDEKSMEDNNTSAFNFRNIDGQEQLSDHSYGIAIDINPLYNPYVRIDAGDRNILPANATPYVNRAEEFSHKISKNDICYNAFISRGWEWGGDWKTPKDYQHFYKNIDK